MPKSTVKDKLAVDGTAKLAARSMPSDKHEAPNLNIEEATVASPRPSRQRAGEFFDFDNEAQPGGQGNGDSVEKVAGSKAAKPKKETKTTSTAGASHNPKRSKKVGKSDEVEKAHTHGVDAAGEIAKESKSKKGKKGKKGKEEKDNDVVGSRADTAMRAGEGSKAKNTGDLIPTEKAHTRGDEDTKIAPGETSKGQKGESAEDNVVVGPNGDTAMVTKEGKKSKNPKASKKDVSGEDKPEKAGNRTKINAGAQEKAESSGKQAKTKKGANADDKPESSRKSKKSGKEPPADVEGLQAPEDPTTSTVVKPKTKSKASKAAAKEALVEHETPAVAPDLSMDEGPFHTLLESEKGQTHMDVVFPKPTKAAKDSKKRSKESKSAAGETSDAKDQEVGKPKKAAKSKGDENVTKKDDAVEHSDTVKLNDAPAKILKPEAAKSKKRKTPTNLDTEGVKSAILDPLSEHASAKKKQKKSKTKTLGDTMGELLTLSLETATQGVNVVRESLGGLVADTPGSLMESAPKVGEGAVDAKDSVKSAAKQKKGKGTAKESEAASVGDENEDEEEDDDEPDDQTTALLKGFESEGDDKDPDEGSGFTEGQAIPALPNPRDTTKLLKAIKEDTSGGPGVVYVGRIPHGFFEHEMRAYFSQFGDISRLRLSRNRKSGASKHFAFVEFKIADVAEVVAKTMNNYLLFGHILKCEIVPREQVHEEMWKGANKRFKAVPWNKIEGRKLEVPVGRQQWKGRVEGEKKRRESNKEKMKEIGYEFAGGALKDVDDVPKKIKEAVIGGTEEQEKSLVTAGAEDEGGSMVVSEEVKTKKVKKGGKGETKETTTTIVKKTKRALEAVEEATEDVPKKAKKAKKTTA